MEYDRLVKENQHHFDNLIDIVIKSGEFFEGNCFYEHIAYNLQPQYIPKQKNIMEIARRANHIIEIGFNAGHSSLLMLLANKYCEIIAIDMCEHSYTKSCVKYLNLHFDNRITLMAGDSHEMLQKLRADNPAYRFDAIHIDGCHDMMHTNIDFFLSLCISNKGSYIILDDTDLDSIHSLWNGYVNDGHVYEIYLEPVFKKRGQSIGIYI